MCDVDNLFCFLWNRTFVGVQTEPWSEDIFSVICSSKISDSSSSSYSYLPTRQLLNDINFYTPARSWNQFFSSSFDAYEIYSIWQLGVWKWWQWRTISSTCKYWCILNDVFFGVRYFLWVTVSGFILFYLGKNRYQVGLVFCFVILILN